MKNLNFDFLLDIWADLKAKKLAPVAIGLVVAAVAIPALLMNGEESASDGPLPILASNPTGGPEVEVSEELADRSSKLDSYKSRDPFKGRVKPDDDLAGNGTASVPSTGGGTEPDKGSSGASGSPLGGLGSGGSSGSSGSSGTSGDGGLGSSPTPVAPPKLDIAKPKRRPYTYQLELKFGRPGRERRYTSVTRMTFLPRPALPALLFMGVREGERSAIFFVYPGMTHQGEGACVPSPKDCNFLELQRGEQHYLAAGDYEFRIELLKIKRVPLSTAKKQQRAAARKASHQRRLSRGDTSADESAEPELPWLADGIG